MEQKRQFGNQVQMCDLAKLLQVVLKPWFTQSDFLYHCFNLFLLFKDPSKEKEKTGSKVMSLFSASKPTIELDLNVFQALTHNSIAL